MYTDICYYCTVSKLDFLLSKVHKVMFTNSVQLQWSDSCVKYYIYLALCKLNTKKEFTCIIYWLGNVYGIHFMWYKIIMFGEQIRLINYGLYWSWSFSTICLKKYFMKLYVFLINELIKQIIVALISSSRINKNKNSFVCSSYLRNQIHVVTVWCKSIYYCNSNITNENYIK